MMVQPCVWSQKHTHKENLCGNLVASPGRGARGGNNIAEVLLFLSAALCCPPPSFTSPVAGHRLACSHVKLKAQSV